MVLLIVFTNIMLTIISAGLCDILDTYLQKNITQSTVVGMVNKN